MKTKIIKTEKEYNEACEKVYQLIHSTKESIDPDSSQGEELELLSLLIEKYEEEHYKLDAPDPIEAILFRMDQMNLKQIDLAPIFGGKTRVSEVLNRKRPLNLKAISLLHQYLGIPLESLIIGNKGFEIQEDDKKRLLNVSSIRDFLKSNRAAMI